MVVVVLVAVLVLSIGRRGRPWRSSGSGGDDPSPTAGRRAHRRPDDDAAGPGPPSRRRPGLAPFYSQRSTGRQCRGGDHCATLTVPLDYADPAARPSTWPCWGAGRRSRARVGSMVVNPGGPGAPGTDYAAAADRASSASRCSTPTTSSASTRAAPAPAPRSTASATTSSTTTSPRTPTPTPRPRSTTTRRSGRRARSRLRRGSGDLAAHVTTIEAARDMDVLRAALGEAKLTYFGASYGTKLGATYAELFPDEVGRLVLDGAVDLSSARASSASSRRPASRPRCAPTCRTASTHGRLLPRRHRRRGARHDHRPARRHRRRAAPDRQRPRAPGRQRLLRHRHAALQPRLLVLLDQALQHGARRRRHAAAAALRRLHLARARRRLHRQHRRGDLRDQLPRRPVRRSRPSEVPANFADFEKASPTFGRRLRLGPDRLRRHPGDVDRGAARRPGRGGRADRGARHHPRPGDAVRVGRAPRRPARVRACWSAATATATPATTRATPASTTRSRTTCVDGTVPEDGLSC